MEELISWAALILSIIAFTRVSSVETKVQKLSKAVDAAAVALGLKPTPVKSQAAANTDVSVDSKPGLYIVMKLMGNIGLQNYQGITFHLLKKTNSANLTQNPKQLDITSYVTGYFK
jgi:hypothetical protein